MTGRFLDEARYGPGETVDNRDFIIKHPGALIIEQSDHSLDAAKRKQGPPNWPVLGIMAIGISPEYGLTDWQQENPMFLSFRQGWAEPRTLESKPAVGR